ITLATNFVTVLLLFSGLAYLSLINGQNLIEQGSLPHLWAFLAFFSPKLPFVVVPATIMVFISSKLNLMA
ncbi:MAG TPA: hypothetical protein VJ044_19775, partial [Candidatus Hodarchaeales archaeon]|nr:hypothetical protein [Candidatus Hodarchaeales archaeon]